MRVALGLLCLAPLAVVGDVLQYPISAQRTNLVDQLSSDPDYTQLLRLLQRARLIPTLNRIVDATLFAPTNEAIERYRNSTSSSSSLVSRIWDVSYYDDPPSHADLTPDNMQLQLRQHLLYHLLNYSLPIMPNDFPNQRPLVLDTLHFPYMSSPPPTDEPAPAPPWLPLPGGSLNQAPQRLRVASRDDAAWVGVDFAGRGGAQVTSGKEPLLASNGIVIPISDVVPVPGNLFEEIKRHPLLREFTSILTEEMIDTLKGTPHLTLFLPIDSAWSAMDSIERRYLHSGYAERDVSRLVGLHLSGAGVNSTGNVGWSDEWEDGSKFTTAEGEELTIGFAANGTVQVGPSTVVQEDIYAANGVIHIVSSLLIHHDTFQINAEKYLLALNATAFVSLLRAANLSHYVDDEHDGQTWTILAPRDDIVTVGSNGRRWDSMLRDEPSNELQRVMSYHFIPGKLSSRDLVDGALLGTELREVGLEGGRQRLPVTVKNDGKVEPVANGEVSFGNARVIADPIETDTFTIYMLSQVLKPPVTSVEKIETSAKLSTYLAAAYAAEMTKQLRTAPSTTLLVPQNSGFERLGLLTDFLLLGELDARKSLKRVIRHHMLHGVYYTADLDLGDEAGKPTNRTVLTREGSNVTVHGTTSVRESGLWARNVSLIPRNELTSTGVVHELSDVLLPGSLTVMIGDLALAAKGETMISLVKRAGLGKLLNGTLRMEDIEELDDWRRTHPRKQWRRLFDWRWFGRYTRQDSISSEKEKESQEAIGWILLCPQDSAFSSINLTALLSDAPALRRLVLQHIIPIPSSSPSLSEIAPELPLSFEDSTTYSTLLSPNSLRADIVFRRTGVLSSKYKPIPGGGPVGEEILIGIKGARGGDGTTDFARVLNYGRTTATPYTPPNSSSSSQVSNSARVPTPPSPARDLSPPRSGVVQIDTLIHPYIPNWWNAWGWAVAFGFVGCLLITAFWVGVGRAWYWKSEEATYEPIGDGAGEGEGEEERFDD